MSRRDRCFCPAGTPNTLQAFPKNERNMTKARVKEEVAAGEAGGAVAKVKEEVVVAEAGGVEENVKPEKEEVAVGVEMAGVEAVAGVAEAAVKEEEEAETVESLRKKLDNMTKHYYERKEAHIAECARLKAEAEYWKVQFERQRAFTLETQQHCNENGKRLRQEHKATERHLQEKELGWVQALGEAKGQALVYQQLLKNEKEDQEKRRSLSRLEWAAKGGGKGKATKSS